MSPFQGVIAFRNKARSKVLSVITVALVATGISVQAQEARLAEAKSALLLLKAGSWKSDILVADADQQRGKPV